MNTVNSLVTLEAISISTISSKPKLDAIPTRAPYCSNAHFRTSCGDFDSKLLVSIEMLLISLPKSGISGRFSSKVQVCHNPDRGPSARELVYQQITHFSTRIFRLTGGGFKRYKVALLALKADFLRDFGRIDAGSIYLELLILLGF